MRRAFVLTLAVLLLLPLTASPTFAHGLGVSYDLPLPLWLYLYGAGATVLVSFAPISLLGGGRLATVARPATHCAVAVPDFRQQARPGEGSPASDRPAPARA